MATSKTQGNATTATPSNFIEVVGDIVGTRAQPGSRVKVFCVSGDLDGSFNAGVAKKMNDVWDIKDQAKELMDQMGIKNDGVIVLEKDGIQFVLLVVKGTQREELTEGKLDNALLFLQSLTQEKVGAVFGTTLPYIAMPRIGCGGGNWEWEKVRPHVIQAVQKMNSVLVEKENKKEEDLPPWYVYSLK